MFGLGPAEVIVMALLLGVVVWIAYRAFRVDDAYVASWAASAGLRLTDATRPALRRYLAWSRRFRTVGALAGWIIIPIVHDETASEPAPLVNGFVFVLAGYLLGAVLAEFTFHRPGRRSGAALMVPRRVSDYLYGYVLFLQRGLAVASVLLLFLYALSPYPNIAIPQPSVIGFAAYGAAAVLIAAVIETLQRLIVSRPQPITGHDGLALDDALRSSSAHTLAGAGIGMLLIVVGAEIAVFAALKGFIGASLMALSLFLWFSALFFWLDLTKPHGFKVRRGPVRETSE